MRIATKENNELAIFGHAPLFAQPLHVGRPNLPDKEAFMRRISDIFDRRWLTNKGPFVLDLEKRIAEYLGVKHCIAICNGTIALEILIQALELKGEVICPSFTFVATAHALKWMGLKPVFCDIDHRTHNLDPDQVMKAITTKTTGILGVHLWGRPCAVDELTKIAQKAKLKLMFDAAHAFGATAGGRKIGGFGNAEVFSFHATKVFNTFEGGAITTNDDALAQRCHLLKNFGFKGYDRVFSLGTNGKMSEIHAAMGLCLLETLPETIEENKKRYGIYKKVFEDLEGARIVEYSKTDENNFQYVALEVDEDRTGISRDAVVKILHAENILARRYFYPGCHRLEPYCSDGSIDIKRLKETERMCQRTLCLPTGPSVSKEDVDSVARLFAAIIKNGKAIASRIPKDR